MEVEAAKICTTPARDNDLEVKIVKKMLKTESLGRFLEVEVAKICTTPARRKSKSLKHQGLGTFFEVQNAFRVVGAGISTQHPHKNRSNVL